MVHHYHLILRPRSVLPVVSVMSVVGKGSSSELCITVLGGHVLVSFDPELYLRFSVHDFDTSEDDKPVIL